MIDLIQGFTHTPVAAQLAPAAHGGAELLQAALFWLFALMAGASAVAVAFTRNIVRMSVLLLLALVGVAGLYFLLAAEFIAAVQLVVYAGGTLILIIFGVMLTSKSPFSRFEPSRVEVVVGAALGAMVLISTTLAIFAWRPVTVDTASTSAPYAVDRLGVALLGDYLIPFELASVILLVVMIGAAYLARARREGPSGDRSASREDRS